MTVRLPEQVNNLFIVALTILPLLFGCETRKEVESPQSGDRTFAGRAGKPHPLEFKNYRETGDLEALQKRGIIRFATYAMSLDDQLPRSMVVSQRHRELAEGFARRLGLHPVWIQADSPEHGIELIRGGQADVLADNFTDTSQRRELVLMSQPLFQTRRVLITSKDGPDIGSIDDLSEVTLVAISGSTFVETANNLVRNNPNSGLTVKEIQIHDNPGQLIDYLQKSPNSVAIFDDNAVNGILEYRTDLIVGAPVSETENISWAVRKNAPTLRVILNNYLTSTLVSKGAERKSDWREIKKSRVLRLLTYNTATSYYLWKGVLMGFDYDLARDFAKAHDLELQVIVVPYGEDLIQWLKQGKGDIAGSSTTITQKRKNQGVDFSVPYIYMGARVLSRRSSPPIKTLKDLDGRILTVRYGSIFTEVAKSLHKDGINVQLEVAPVSFAHLVNLLTEGELDVIADDSHMVEIESSLRLDLEAGPELIEPKPQGWMVLPEHPVLLEKVNEFISDYLHSSVYKEKLNAYFKPSGRYGNRARARIVPGADLSPFDTLVRSSAQTHNFDWRLIVAQMWQESSFNPRATSPVGAQGLLQVMPRTAEDMGYTPPLFDPELGIRAGVKYLAWVRNRFEETMPTDEKLWFSLAAYNAGYAHVLDARRLAEELGLDPDIWFNNVELAMLKLSEPRYYNKARYGYVRGAEPVRYVRNISELYKAYMSVSKGSVRDKNTHETSF